LTRNAAARTEGRIKRRFLNAAHRARFFDPRGGKFQIKIVGDGTLDKLRQLRVLK